MRKDVMEMWVKALRSGNYSQTKECLHDSKGMCCLGVLCDIYTQGREGWAEWDLCDEEERVDDHGNIEDYAQWSMFDNHETLPCEVREWANIKHSDGSFETEGCDGTQYTESLATLNDKGYTFNDLADIIEKKWSNL
jgi:hypothetical protein